MWMQWIRVVPAPCQFVHPIYGHVVFTAEGNQRIVDNLRTLPPVLIMATNRNDHIVVGMILAGFVADDGGIDVEVSWRDSAGPFADAGDYYLAPAIVPEWTDVVTGETYTCVLVGASLTRDPVFDDDAFKVSR